MLYRVEVGGYRPQEGVVEFKGRRIFVHQLPHGVQKLQKNGTSFAVLGILAGVSHPLIEFMPYKHE